MIGTYFVINAKKSPIIAITFVLNTRIQEKKIQGVAIPPLLGGYVKKVTHNIPAISSRIRPVWVRLRASSTSEASGLLTLWIYDFHIESHFSCVLKKKKKTFSSCEFSLVVFVLRTRSRYIFKFLFSLHSAF